MASNSFKWTRLFDNEASSSSMAKVDITLENGRTMAPSEVVENDRKCWEAYLVGHFFGWCHPFPTVHRFLQARWKIVDPLAISLHENKFCIKMDKGGKEKDSRSWSNFHIRSSLFTATVRTGNGEPTCEVQ